MIKIRDQYNTIINKIDQEKDSEKEYILSFLVTDESGSEDRNDVSEGSGNKLMEHEENMFALMCLKLNLYVRLNLFERLA